jgi:alanine dehydrogenase
VLIQEGAGKQAGFTDSLYRDAGARLASSAEEVFDTAEMIIKVKEPQKSEIELLSEDQILFTYLHLAADCDLARSLLERGVAGVAYETIAEKDGDLPCLQPMSQIAGRLAVQEGAKYLEIAFGGRGVLLGGVPGVARGNVGILGGGTVGLNACKVAVGLGAQVTVLDIRAERLAYFDDLFQGSVTTLYSTPANVETVLAESDLVIGAVLRRGAKAPHLVTRKQLGLMKEGSVIVDVAVDQGGCFETTRPTTHDEPTYVIDGVVHYCVANMPGTVALTSTRALTSTTLRYGLLLADEGVAGAAARSAALARGVNLYRGACVCQPVAEACSLPYRPLEDLLK